MSQIVAVKTRTGVILAADGKALDIDSSGQLVEMEANRLIQLTPYTAVLAGGAAEGTYMCQNVREFIQQEGLRTIDEVCGAAFPFLAAECERFMRNRSERLLRLEYRLNQFSKENKPLN